ncbi:adenosylcobinamide-GDP ribazoletransferase [Bosea sp. 124]|uniref:adenosylcobinamide-GDP ribazoletransferase n=1 Tax=Bosea sp. 124 TaxID=2135642 RepID=UPI000D39EFFA|nr:adenosylcobinamide-GDP ribazoletransferase [Bosea sp. 124]PTM38667.1 cobalamin-5'-phosphate synthase [Bosea sp. 124]
MAEASTGTAPPPQHEPAWPGWPVATAICIRFYSRLPVPILAGESDPHASPDFRAVPRALPIAALIIALPAALVLFGAGLAGLAPTLAATLAVTALALATGAFHEDGLADTADGLFGGHTAERRLEIMKDSRVGSYGAIALGLSLMLRVTALASILEAAGAWAATAALLAAAPWSRAEGLRLLATQEPARSGGASASVGQPSRDTAVFALAASGALALVAALASPLPVAGLAVGLLLARLAAMGLARLAGRLIGGQTGDILGATQQLAEIAIYLGFALALGLGRP